MIAVDASISADPGFGAISFEGTDGADGDAFAATIVPGGASTGHVTSLIVNTPLSEDVGLGGDLTVDGIIFKNDIPQVNTNSHGNTVCDVFRLHFNCTYYGLDRAWIYT